MTTAIYNALHFNSGYSCSDGNMVVGWGDKEAPDQVAVAFNETRNNKRQLVILERSDAQALHALLGVALKHAQDVHL